MKKPLHYEAELLFKYWNNQLTDAEKRALEEWASQSAERTALLEQFKDASYLQHNIETLQEGDEKRIWDKMVQLEPGLRPGRERKLWLGLAAAAVILLIISVTIMFIFNKNERTKKAFATTSAQQDVAPGSNKATLILANGQSVVLDSTAGKTLTQGNVRIMNKDGQLVYVPAQATSSEELYNTLTTSRGQTYSLTLSDRSRVWLNAASSIRYPAAFTGRERKVEITGEAYFEVAHLAGKPFYVMINGVTIQVFGTSFNVNGYKDEHSINTTLIEGSVSITKGDQKKKIKPAQQAQVVADVITIIDKVDLDKTTAWKKGLFTFRGDKLSSVMKDIARWYNIEVEFEGGAGNVEISGDLHRAANLSQVLKILSVLDVESKLEGRKLILKAQ